MVHLTEPTSSDLTIRLPATLTLGDIMDLEAALAQGVTQMAAWLTAHDAVDLGSLRSLPWAEMETLRTRLREAVKEAGRVPPASS